jgi:DNA-binding GntR family transcriptional regulator
MSRTSGSFIPHVVLDRASSTPMHRQIYHAVAQEIATGDAVRNARLPSTRTMAKLLNVSRNTILRAYDELAADGLIEGHHGSGMRILGNTVSPEPTWFGLRHVISQSGFPARTVSFEDCDGNPLYFRY